MPTLGNAAPFLTLKAPAGAAEPIRSTGQIALVVCHFVPLERRDQRVADVRRPMILRLGSHMVRQGVDFHTMPVVRFEDAAQIPTKFIAEFRQQRRMTIFCSEDQVIVPIRVGL